MKVLITAAAEADLEAIGDYISREDPARALSFARELYQLCLDIADMPRAWLRVSRAKHSYVFYKYFSILRDFRLENSTPVLHPFHQIGAQGGRWSQRTRVCSKATCTEVALMS